MLHRFSGTPDGERLWENWRWVRMATFSVLPSTAVISGIYGIAFELKRSETGAWKETILHSFAGGNADGYIPSLGWSSSPDRAVSSARRSMAGPEQDVQYRHLWHGLRDHALTVWNAEENNMIVEKTKRRGARKGRKGGEARLRIGKVVVGLCQRSRSCRSKPAGDDRIR